MSRNLFFAASCFALLATVSVQAGTITLHPTEGGVIRIKGPNTTCTSNRTCTWAVTDGVTYEFIVDAEPYYQFAGWTGMCAGIGECKGVIKGNATLTATFKDIGPPKVTVTVDVDGSGTVGVSTGGGWGCRAIQCTHTQRVGETLTFFASPDPGRELKEWYGPCAGTTAPTCTLTMKGNVQLGAKFGNPSPH
jgi:hypothetical protein